MNIITTINTALQHLNADVEVFLLQASRAENEELEHTKPVVVVYPDWTTRNELNMGVGLLKERTYSIDFKTQDEWDNSDNDNDIYGESSVSKIEEMEILADSVFSFINFKNELFPEISKNLQWKVITPILREGNGTMSGVSIELTITFMGKRVCDYSKI